MNRYITLLVCMLITCMVLSCGKSKPLGHIRKATCPECGYIAYEHLYQKRFHHILIPRVGCPKDLAILEWSKIEGEDR